MSARPTTFLCIATYFKGIDFIKACKALGNHVFLLTTKKQADADWPWEAIDDIFYIENAENSHKNYDAMVQGLAYLMRRHKIDRVVALDDFDVEKGAFLREAFRIPGMGLTTGKLFRDKLAMRIQARDAGIAVPPFSALFNDEEVNHYLGTVPGPWVIKPRSEASAVGIKKVSSAAEAWAVINELGEDRYRYLIEQFLPGDVYHADAITVDGDVKFCLISKYLNPPFDVAHGGGVFMTQTLARDSAEDQALQSLNQTVLQAFRMQFSASHTEFIQAKSDGKFYFLETSSRVGGAHISDLVYQASGLNIWAEWAKVESAMAKGEEYMLPDLQTKAAGLIVSLSRFEHPDTSSFVSPEIVWRLKKPYHIGFIVKGDDGERIHHLLNYLAGRIRQEFHASLPPKDSLTDNT